MAKNEQNLKAGDVAVFTDGRNKNVFAVLKEVKPFRTTFGGRIDPENIWTRINDIYYKLRPIIKPVDLDFGITYAVRVDGESDVIENLNGKFDSERYEIVPGSETIKYPFDNPMLSILVGNDIMMIDEEDLRVIMEDSGLKEITVYRPTTYKF